MVQSLYASLDRLKTDYIDVFLVHIRDQFTPALACGGTFELIDPSPVAQQH